MHTILSISLLLIICSCLNSANGSNLDSTLNDTCGIAAPAEVTSMGSYDALSGEEIPMYEYSWQGHSYMLADITDSAVLYKNEVIRANCFMVASKREYRLYVYEVVRDAVDSITKRPINDTILVAHFPICYAKKIERKTCSGDGCTPESTMQHPCYIKSIEPSSGWDHDFGDGRGVLYPYGPWFLRLRLPDSDNNTIGIHGCTTNEVSVPGRDSEGCIRMRDDDLCVLRRMYAANKQKVVIKAYTELKYQFEVRAQQKLGKVYVAPVYGCPYRTNEGK